MALITSLQQSLDRSTAVERSSSESDDDDEDDEFTANLEQVGKFVFPRFSIWPHLRSVNYNPSDIAKKLSAAANDIKSLCMNLSESFSEVINSAVEYPIEDIVGGVEHDSDADADFDPDPDPSGVARLKPKEVSDFSLVQDRLVNYDHLTYLTFEQFKDEIFLRKRIKEILGLDLAPVDKRFLIQKLMTRTFHEKMKYEGSVENESEYVDNGISSAEDDEVVLSDDDLRPSYFDQNSHILGCKHYQTNCKIECAICKKWYPCRFCHDQQVKSHKLPRSATRYVLCMFCCTPQYPQQFCVSCNCELARYYCDKCKLFDNDPMKHIYHCEKCGICRLGLGLNQDYFHCDNCHACISIELKDRHVCIENSTLCNCPICDEYMFDSIKTVVFMSCGHPIHQSCYDEYTKHSYKCPLCSKTIVNMEAQFRVLDKEIEQTIMPDGLGDWKALIKCVDCGGRSKVPYHYLGLRCEHCKSYNTMQLTILKGDGELKNADGCAASIGIPDLIKNSLDQNFAFEGKVDDDTDRKLDENAKVEDSYVRNFIRVIDSFEKYPSITEAFKDWMSGSMPSIE
ncbi:hypothetical protein FOA43_000608 [Brettanomyces nanus]|uniref:Uncharacterized protein n=1 Tax=Eeniella nana TaxID=13502 RepID=A0A875RXE6_EENNA|nr:uncharacterized protein FOA43_000608 [Brettanomyces nanus]QPG73298.1 hypothetical protein FOA43_000608 [Brettanomyces nanus]